MFPPPPPANRNQPPFAVWAAAVLSAGIPTADSDPATRWGCACTAATLRTTGCICHRDDDDRDERPSYEEHSA